MVFSVFGRWIEYLLFVGVVVFFMLGVFFYFILFIVEFFVVNKVVFWLMGSLVCVEVWYVWIMLFIVVLSVVVLLFFGCYLDVLLLGDESVKLLGVNVIVICMLCFVICVVFMVCIVFYCGGIGFVGFMILYIIWYWFGVISCILIMGCVLLGGIFMVSVDILVRMLLLG